MKLRTFSFILLPISALAIAVGGNWPLAVVAFWLVGALLLPSSKNAYDATFILPLLLKKMMEAFKSRLPQLNYFSMDATAERVKYGQEVIAQMPQIPTALDHVPGNSLTANSVDIKTLFDDVKMKINKCKKVILKVPTSDAVKLELDPAFQEAIANAGFALAESVVTEALAFVNPTTFTKELVEPLVEVDKVTLSRARVAMNQSKAGDRRFGLAGSDFMSSLTNDPRIASGDYYGQRVDGNPYVTLNNIEGFQAVSEYAQFPTANNLLAFMFDPRALLIAIRQMTDTLDMARRLGIPVPILDETRVDPQTGLSFTSYMWIDTATHDIYAAFVVMFGVSGGRLALDGSGDQVAGAANSAIDRSGLRIVSAATV